jgi:lactoylglutathione lyase
MTKLSSGSVRGSGEEHREKGLTAMIKNIVAVDVYVSDQDKALDFYEHTLDFEKVADETWDGIRWIEVAPAKDQQTTLTLLNPLDFDLSEDHIGRDTNVAFETDDIHTTYQELKKQSVRFKWQPKQSSTQNWDCQFCDQDNNTFLLVQYFRPQGRHPVKE